MNYNLKYILKKSVIFAIGSSDKFKLPELISEYFGGKNEVLLKVILPKNKSMIYSIYKDKYLKINEYLKAFFNSLLVNEKIFIKIEETTLDNEMKDYYIYISRNFEMNDIQISELPVIANDVISFLSK